MDVGPGFGAGDPAAGGVRRGSSTVKGGGQFQHDPRKPGAAVLEIRSKQFGSLNGPHARFHGNPSLLERGDALSRHRGVGILNGHHHSGHPRGSDGVGTRPGAALVVARLQRGVEVGPIGSRPGSL